MFSEDKLESISAHSETELIERIRKRLGSVSLTAPEGIGDDCAVLTHKQATKQILTTDSLSYGIHFDDKVTASNAGAKLIKRNLSDLAAMGGTPGPALLNLLISSDLRVDWLDSFIDGLRECCVEYGVSIVGGDISELPGGQFTAVLTQTGATVCSPLLRSGACLGDHIFVTGSLGGSRRNKHYSFTPRLIEGQWLAQLNFVRGTMDLTDGLAKDLRAILPENSQAALYLDQIPLSKDAQRASLEDGRSSIEHAFCDGEDYELLFCIPKELPPEKFITQWQDHFPEVALTQIGEITRAESNAAYVDAETKEDLPWQRGFEHLSK